MTSWLIITLLSGGIAEPVEMPVAQCLRREMDINTSRETFAFSADGRKGRVLWATCRPWPPVELDPCECLDRSDLTQ